MQVNGVKSACSLGVWLLGVTSEQPTVMWKGERGGRLWFGGLASFSPGGVCRGRVEGRQGMLPSQSVMVFHHCWRNPSGPTWGWQVPQLLNSAPQAVGGRGWGFPGVSPSTWHPVALGKLQAPDQQVWRKEAARVMGRGSRGDSSQEIGCWPWSTCSVGSWDSSSHAGKLPVLPRGVKTGMGKPVTGKAGSTCLTPRWAPSMLICHRSVFARSEQPLKKGPRGKRTRQDNLRKKNTNPPALSATKLSQKRILAHEQEPAGMTEAKSHLQELAVTEP